MRKLFDILGAYRRTRDLRFTDRATLENYQQTQLDQMQKRLVHQSPYFARFAGTPWSQWPLMDKQVMMRNFDSMNTAGLKLERVLDTALQAEQSRSFSPTVDGYTVGLSSGTSGSRGVFVVGAREKNRWAGIMLAKALPRGLFAGERAALFLRANSNLYTAVRAPFLKFEFFDLLAVWDEHLGRLERYNPTVIVAPAQVLRRLALERQAGRISIAPARLLSAAEVLEQQDRELITSVFGPVLGEVYQATEGFLGVTCSHGRLHLNEEFIHVEPDWLDSEQRRFVPIVTDFSRETQPIVRYRLNDVLVASHEQCSCGSATRVISAIEGRCDDMLRLPGKHGAPVEVFADAISRVLLQSLPLDTDYRLTQTAASDLLLEADLTGDQQQSVRRALTEFFEQQGVATPLRWTFLVKVPSVDFTRKRRRIIRQWTG
jgi:putative adenylate-forming enzyme